MGVGRAGDRRADGLRGERFTRPGRSWSRSTIPPKASRPASRAGCSRTDTATGRIGSGRDSGCTSGGIWASSPTSGASRGRVWIRRPSSRNEWIDIHGLIKTPQVPAGLAPRTRLPLPFTLWSRVPTLHSGRKGLRPLGPSSISPGGAPRYAPASGALDPIRSGDRRAPRL